MTEQTAITPLSDVLEAMDGCVQSTEDERTARTLIRHAVRQARRNGGYDA